MMLPVLVLAAALPILVIVLFWGLSQQIPEQSYQTMRSTLAQWIIWHLLFVATLFLTSGISMSVVNYYRHSDATSVSPNDVTDHQARAGDPHEK